MYRTDPANVKAGFSAPCEQCDHIATGPSQEETRRAHGRHALDHVAPEARIASLGRLVAAHAWSLCRDFGDGLYDSDLLAAKDAEWLAILHAGLEDARKTIADRPARRARAQLVGFSGVTERQAANE